MDLSRRQVIVGAAGGTGLLAGARATQNVVLGYGRLTGTNLKQQELEPLVLDGFEPHDGPITTGEGPSIAVRDGDLLLPPEGPDRRQVHPDETTPGRAAEIERELDLPAGSMTEPVADLSAVGRGDVQLEVHPYPAFFARVGSARARPYTVGALRGPRRGDRAAVERVVDADPADTSRLVEALAAGLREHTSYDLARYVAGSIEDNVLFGLLDLRQRFESPTDYGAIAADEDSGLFCYELVYRSIEAFHAVDAPDQAVPVLAGYVHNRRHKHAYTILASVVREAGELVVPVTFVDYTRSTLYDDLNLRGVLGEGLDAYTDRQRVTSIHWAR